MRGRLAILDAPRAAARGGTPRELAAEVYGDAELDILIAGDSHYERLVHRDGMLLLDPGSPTFPHHQRTRLGSVALLELTADGVHAELVLLGDTPGAPNPATPASVTYDRTGLIEASVAGEPVERMAFRPPRAPRLRV